MARRNRTPDTGDLRAVSEYYKLNTKAVDDLVTADVTNSPKVSEEELRKYRSGSKLKLSDWLKAVLIKAWFAGSVCFFFLWGLGTYITNQLDMLLVVGAALGVVKDLLENNIFRFYAETPGANDRFMMFPQKKYVTLFLNILYGYLILFCVFMTYNMINAVAVGITGDAENIPLGVGPILFGIFSMVYDMLFLLIKRTAKKIIIDAKSAQYNP